LGDIRRGGVLPVGQMWRFRLRCAGGYAHPDAAADRRAPVQRLGSACARKGGSRAHFDAAAGTRAPEGAGAP